MQRQNLIGQNGFIGKLGSTELGDAWEEGFRKDVILAALGNVAEMRMHRARGEGFSPGVSLGTLDNSEPHRAAHDSESCLALGRVQDTEFMSQP